MTRGRRTKLTPEVQKAICDAIGIGASREIAARAAGICKTTLYRWLARGEAEQERLQQKGARPRQRETHFCEFRDALTEAEAKGEVHHLEVIAADGATGSKWILERRHPDRWARLEKRQVELKGGVEVTYVNDWRPGTPPEPASGTEEDN